MHIKLARTYYSVKQSVNNTQVGSDAIPSAKIDRGVLVIGFSLTRGGGITELEVNICDDDICAIMHDLAARRPDLAGKFAECTSIAIRNLTAK